MASGARRGDKSGDAVVLHPLRERQAEQSFIKPELISSSSVASMVEGKKEVISRVKQG